MRAQQVISTVGETAATVLPANPNRVSLVLSGDGTNTLTISLQGTAVATKGLVLTPTNPVQRLHRDDVGAMIEQPVSAVASASGATLTILEGFV